MVPSAGVGLERRPRRRHRLSEKRIVELTFEPRCERGAGRTSLRCECEPGVQMAPCLRAL